MARKIEAAASREIKILAWTEDATKHVTPRHILSATSTAKPAFYSRNINTMINLHESLSEFSYGYGITRSVEDLLSDIGVKSTPFLPNLRDEGEIGFDVSFDKPGAVLILQFKLGVLLSRFRRSYSGQPIPSLSKPFWRFSIDTSGHQFSYLREYEKKGADVYYVAPKFTEWREYCHLYEKGLLLEKSALLSPNEIDTLTAGTKGLHRVVYDNDHHYVCSEPKLIRSAKKDDIEKSVRRLLVNGKSLSEIVKSLSSTQEQAEQSITRRIEYKKKIFERARSESDAQAAIIGLDAWLQGAQVIFISSSDGIQTSEMRLPNQTSE